MGRKCEAVDDFRAKLKQNGANMPEYLLHILLERSKSPLPKDKAMGTRPESADVDLDIMSWCWSIMAAAAAAEAEADLEVPARALICWLRNLVARLAESSSIGFESLQRLGHIGRARCRATWDVLLCFRDFGGFGDAGQPSGTRRSSPKVWVFRVIWRRHTRKAEERNGKIGRKVEKRIRVSSEISVGMFERDRTDNVL